jgi:hypothetical protein
MNNSRCDKYTGGYNINGSGETWEALLVLFWVAVAVIGVLL